MSEADYPSISGRALLPAVRPPRQLVADVVPIFDSARFEHYGRIASVMARSTLVPQTLRAGTPDEAVANCIQVVEFADRANYSPFAVAQCASVVHGKLMFEGKLVDAMLQTKLGIELNCYYTGTRGADDRRIYVTDAELTEEQYEALAPGKYPFGIRMIDGSIAEWKTFEKGGGVSKAWTGQQSEMQLGYKGKRTWARGFRPAVMLGVVTDDEVQDFEDRRLEAAPTLLASDFKDQPKPPRRARKPEAPPATDETGNAPEGPTASQEARDGGEFEEGEFEDACDHAWETSEDGDKVCTKCGYVPDDGDGERPTTPAAPTATGPAQHAEPQPDTSASAPPASTASPEKEASSPPPASEATETGSVAPADTVYTLASDVEGDDGKVPTYKNGEQFSRVKADSKARPPTYERHAAVAEAATPEEEEPGEFSDEAQEEAAEPGDVIVQGIAAIRAAAHYPAARQIQRTLAKTDAYAEATLQAKSGVRLAMWSRYTELLEQKVETVQPYEDFLLMRMFLEFGATSPAHVDEVWTRFWRHAAYKDASDGDKKAMNNLMVAAKDRLKGE